MPRRKRCYLPGVPSHVVQRGNNRQDCFFSDEDRGFYIKTLTRALERFDVELHAYVLMTNHVHLLMTPSSEDGISKVMQALGRSYVGYINHRYQRTGTLWEGRHRSSLIDSEPYLLTCQRYIELNPVRAGMVAYPGQYFWSSYQSNVNGRAISCITPHDIYLRLGNSSSARQKAYRSLFEEGFPEADLEHLRECLKHNYPLGEEGFEQRIQQQARVQVGNLHQGRPKRVEK
ncbi:transposase [Oceanimonas marisflavi]|uniref:transposase n=1 Tax=Oceanimonas marisflavi TaxID=2059724 RepID=UPI000D32145F|nr:transposase [Oceanimonas marisflavi]